MRNMFDSGAGERRSDYERCARMIRCGSRSFFAASLLLPREAREAAYAIYAFCRYSDDVVDLGGGGLGDIRRLYGRLDAAYAGAPHDSPIDRAFADVVLRYGVPRALPAALLEGLCWDAQGRRYQSFDDLCDYAVRVAGAVGAIMSVLMGARSPLAIARASDLGVAMQFTNIARDVGEDARAGRIYIPYDWLAEAGLDVEPWLSAPAPNEAVRTATKRLLDVAADYYARGLSGVALLPRSCRASIVAAAHIYADIGAVIAAHGYDSITRRATTSGGRKLVLLLEALTAPTPDAAAFAAPPLPAARFLVDAVDAHPGPPRAAAQDDSFGAVIDLFMRLEKRDRTVADIAR